MYNKMQDDGIQVDKMLTLIRDGPNVNKTIFQKMNELISGDHPEFKGLINLGSCTLHTVHNAFGKGIEQYGKDIDNLCMDLHTLFKYSAARREDYKDIQIEFELPEHAFQQHTEVRWLSLGPAIKRILEQWDAIVHFVTELAKDSSRSPKSVAYKRVYMMLGTKERGTTKVTLEFLRDVMPVFEKFLLLFQKASPVIHVVYDNMCDTLLKLMRRFMKPQTTEKKYGAELVSIQCTDTKLQLVDKELTIGDATRKALATLQSDKQKHAMLGIRAFFSTTTSYLQQKLPLSNDLLRQLGCLNPKKRDRKSTVTSIESITCALQPKVNVSEVLDEWKLFQVDNDVPVYSASDRIETFWNKVFQIHSDDGDARYKVLPCVIKSALVLAQTNAESERSLSINARIVTQERASLSESTIVGLHVLKDAVNFYDPITHRPEKIPVTKDLKKAVKLAHSAYKERLEMEKEVEAKKMEEAKKQKDMTEKERKEKEKLIEKKESLAKTEEDLNEQESKALQNLEAAEELLNDATSKLQDALASKTLNKNSVTAATMMLKSAKETRKEAMDQLEKIRKKQKSQKKTAYELLDQALPSSKVLQMKRKSEEDEKCGKKLRKK